MEGSRPGVGNLEAIIVVLVLIDIVVREIGNSNIKAEKWLVQVIISFHDEYDESHSGRMMTSTEMQNATK
jgi:hypothetical protein